MSGDEERLLESIPDWRMKADEARQAIDRIKDEARAEAFEQYRAEVFERLDGLDAVRGQIRACEGKHIQQVCFSTYHDALTQICFSERKVRSNALYLIEETRNP